MSSISGSADSAKIQKLDEKSDTSQQPPSDCGVENNGSGRDISRAKAATMVTNDACASAPPLPGLEHFSLDRVLFEDPKTKSIAVAGRFASSADTAIIVAEKSPLSRSSLSQLFCPDSKISTNFHNNIYSQIKASCRGSVGDLRLMTVYPATEAHLIKYSQQTHHMIHETPEDYAAITRPYIDGQSFDIQVWPQSLMSLLMPI